MLKLDSLAARPPQLILAAFTNRSDVQTLSGFAKENKVPLLSMTLPNDGGVVDNPYFFMANPGLKTQVEHLCRYLQKNHPLETIQLVTRKGLLEEQVLGHFAQFNKQTKGSPLKFNTTTLPDSVSAAALWQNLDSTQAQVMVGASLQDAFATQLLRITGNSRNKKIKLLGMPTWENLRETPKEADFVYATAFSYNRNDAWIVQLTQKYRDQIFGRPSDMVLKGFEALFHFGQLLSLYPNDFLAHINDGQFLLSNQFQFLPVRNKNNAAQNDYFENKQVYFLRKAKGEIRKLE
ncbi:MAG: hypothetical protein EAZ62_03080 [Sphingobacteriia bacterium]|nr:MAG: hypothetical protein EAZ62_03080 [Sphingobacteriia bacterium]